MSGYEGKTQVNVTFVLPAQYKERAEKFFATAHKPWIKETHSKLGLLFYTVTINDELKDPFNPASEKTGNIIVLLTEVYATPEGLAQHWATAPVDVPEAFAEFQALAGIASTEGGGFSVAQGNPICVSLGPGDLDWNVPKQ